MKRSAKRTEKIICWVEPELRRVIEAAAQADERTVSDWLRLAAKRAASGEEYTQVMSDHRAERVREGTARALDGAKKERHDFNLRNYKSIFD
jgi:uncharacterized protein (DUF1778 family)